MADVALRSTIAAKLTEYRKKSGMTQAELAEKINYSDKSVSKWERGDGVPDIFVLRMLADMYGVTVNELVYEQDELPERTAPAEPEVPETTEQPKKSAVPLSGRSRMLVGVLAVGLVWLVAVLAFFTLKVAVPSLGKTWMTFICAIPASAVIAVVFTSLWGSLLHRFLAVSALVWSSAMTIQLLFGGANRFFGWIYLVAGTLQILAALWFLLLRQKRREQAEGEAAAAEDTEQPANE